MRSELVQRLREHGIQPSAQRLAVAGVVLETELHPSAEEVWEQAQRLLPMVSRATVYNTLNLLVRKGLIRELVLTPGRVVFDPRLEPHHHFIDQRTGHIEDVPWDAVKVSDLSGLEGYEVREYMVVMRGRKLSGPRRTGRGASAPKKR